MSVFKSLATYRNNKNQNLYEHLGVVVDQTNARVGTRMVLYRSLGKDLPLHVRDEAEFHLKFTLVECSVPTDKPA